MRPKPQISGNDVAKGLKWEGGISGNLYLTQEKIPNAMRLAGRISNWNDDKGFGFVTPHDGGQRAFVHIKAFDAATRRPLEGDLISYATSVDTKGRINASDVRFAGQRAQAKVAPRVATHRQAASRVPRLAIGLTFLVTAIALMMMGLVPAGLSLAYLLMSLASYFVYALDKEIAGNARWRRTPESTLHMLDLMGGWPGGLIAQQVMRHKTVKSSFQSAFWLTVLLNLVLYGLIWRSGLAAAVTKFLFG